MQSSPAGLFEVYSNTFSHLHPFKETLGNCSFCNRANNSGRIVSVSFMNYATSVDYEMLLDRGYIRSGNVIYIPSYQKCCCPNIPFRTNAIAFKPNRDQLKTLRSIRSYLSGEKILRIRVSSKDVFSAFMRLARLGLAEVCTKVLNHYSIHDTKFSARELMEFPEFQDLFAELESTPDSTEQKIWPFNPMSRKEMESHIQEFLECVYCSVDGSIERDEQLADVDMMESKSESNTRTPILKENRLSLYTLFDRSPKFSHLGPMKYRIFIGSLLLKELSNFLIEYARAQFSSIPDLPSTASERIIREKEFLDYYYRGAVRDAISQCNVDFPSKDVKVPDTRTSIEKESFPNLIASSNVCFVVEARLSTLKLNLSSEGKKDRRVLLKSIGSHICDRLNAIFSALRTEHSGEISVIPATEFHLGRTGDLATSATTTVTSSRNESGSPENLHLLQRPFSVPIENAFMLHVSATESGFLNFYGSSSIGTVDSSMDTDDQQARLDALIENAIEHAFSAIQSTFGVSPIDEVPVVAPSPEHSKISNSKNTVKGLNLRVGYDFDYRTAHSPETRQLLHKHYGLLQERAELYGLSHMRNNPRSLFMYRDSFLFPRSVVSQYEAAVKAREFTMESVFHVDVAEFEAFKGGVSYSSSSHSRASSSSASADDAISAPKSVRSLSFSGSPILGLRYPPLYRPQRVLSAAGGSSLVKSLEQALRKQFGSSEHLVQGGTFIGSYLLDKLPHGAFHPALFHDESSSFYLSLLVPPTGIRNGIETGGEHDSVTHSPSLDRRSAAVRIGSDAIRAVRKGFDGVAGVVKVVGEGVGIGAGAGAGSHNYFDFASMDGVEGDADLNHERHNQHGNRSKNGKRDVEITNTSYVSGDEDEKHRDNARTDSFPNRPFSGSDMEEDADRGTEDEENDWFIAGELEDDATASVDTRDSRGILSSLDLPPVSKFSLGIHSLKNELFYDEDMQSRTNSEPTKSSSNSNSRKKVGNGGSSESGGRAGTSGHSNHSDTVSQAFRRHQLHLAELRSSIGRSLNFSSVLAGDEEIGLAATFIDTGIESRSRRLRAVLSEHARERSEPGEEENSAPRFFLPFGLRPRLRLQIRLTPIIRENPGVDRAVNEIYARFNMELHRGTLRTQSPHNLARHLLVPALRAQPWSETGINLAILCKGVLRGFLARSAAPVSSPLSPQSSPSAEGADPRLEGKSLLERFLLEAPPALVGTRVSLLKDMASGLEQWDAHVRACSRVLRSGTLARRGARFQNTLRELAAVRQVLRQRLRQSRSSFEHLVQSFETNESNAVGTDGDIEDDYLEEEPTHRPVNETENSLSSGETLDLSLESVLMRALVANSFFEDNPAVSDETDDHTVADAFLALVAAERAVDELPDGVEAADLKEEQKWVRAAAAVGSADALAPAQAPEDPQLLLFMLSRGVLPPLAFYRQVSGLMDQKLDQLSVYDEFASLSPQNPAAEMETAEGIWKAARDIAAPAVLEGGDWMDSLVQAVNEREEAERHRKTQLALQLSVEAEMRCYHRAAVQMLNEVEDRLGLPRSSVFPGFMPPAFSQNIPSNDTESNSKESAPREDDREDPGSVEKDALRAENLQLREEFIRQISRNPLPSQLEKLLEHTRYAPRICCIRVHPRVRVSATRIKHGTPEDFVTVNATRVSNAADSKRLYEQYLCTALAFNLNLDNTLLNSLRSALTPQHAHLVPNLLELVANTSAFDPISTPLTGSNQIQEEPALEPFLRFAGNMQARSPNLWASHFQLSESTLHLNFLKRTQTAPNHSLLLSNDAIRRLSGTVDIESMSALPVERPVLGLRSGLYTYNEALRLKGIPRSGPKGSESSTAPTGNKNENATALFTGSPFAQSVGSAVGHWTLRQLARSQAARRMDDHPVIKGSKYWETLDAWRKRRHTERRSKRRSLQSEGLSQTDMSTESDSSDKSPHLSNLKKPPVIFFSDAELDKMPLDQRSVQLRLQSRLHIRASLLAERERNNPTEYDSNDAESTARSSASFLTMLSTFSNEALNRRLDELEAARKSRLALAQSVYFLREAAGLVPHVETPLFRPPKEPLDLPGVPNSIPVPAAVAPTLELLLYSRVFQLLQPSDCIIPAHNALRNLWRTIAAAMAVVRVARERLRRERIRALYNRLLDLLGQKLRSSASAFMESTASSDSDAPWDTARTSSPRSSAAQRPREHSCGPDNSPKRQRLSSSRDSSPSTSTADSYPQSDASREGSPLPSALPPPLLEEESQLPSLQLGGLYSSDLEEGDRGRAQWNSKFHSSSDSSEFYGDQQPPSPSMRKREEDPLEQLLGPLALGFSQEKEPFETHEKRLFDDLRPFLTVLSTLVPDLHLCSPADSAALLVLQRALCGEEELGIEPPTAAAARAIRRAPLAEALLQRALALVEGGAALSAEFDEAKDAQQSFKFSLKKSCLQMILEFGRRAVAPFNSLSPFSPILKSHSEVVPGRISFYERPPALMQMLSDIRTVDTIRGTISACQPISRLFLLLLIPQLSIEQAKWWRSAALSSMHAALRAVVLSGDSFMRAASPIVEGSLNPLIYPTLGREKRTTTSAGEVTPAEEETKADMDAQRLELHACIVGASLPPVQSAFISPIATPYFKEPPHNHQLSQFFRLGPSIWDDIIRPDRPRGDSDAEDVPERLEVSEPVLLNKGNKKMKCKNAATRGRKDNEEGMIEVLGWDTAMGTGAFLQEYYIEGVLVACTAVDRLPSRFSSIYFFYDPDFRFLELGKLSALAEMFITQETFKFCRKYPHLSTLLPDSIGPMTRYWDPNYYCHPCDRMNYKRNYSPSEIQCPVMGPAAWVPAVPEVLRWFDEDLGFPISAVNPLNSNSPLFNPSLCLPSKPNDLDRPAASKLGAAGGEVGVSEEKSTEFNEDNWQLPLTSILRTDSLNFFRHPLIRTLVGRVALTVRLAAAHGTFERNVAVAVTSPTINSWNLLVGDPSRTTTSIPLLQGLLGVSSSLHGSDASRTSLRTDRSTGSGVTRSSSSSSHSSTGGMSFADSYDQHLRQTRMMFSPTLPSPSDTNGSSEGFQNVTSTSSEGGAEWEAEESGSAAGPAAEKEKSLERKAGRSFPPIDKAKPLHVNQPGRVALLMQLLRDSRLSLKADIHFLAQILNERLPIASPSHTPSSMRRSASQNSKLGLLRSRGSNTSLGPSRGSQVRQQDATSAALDDATSSDSGTNGRDDFESHSRSLVKKFLQFSTSTLSSAMSHLYNQFSGSHTPTNLNVHARSSSRGGNYSFEEDESVMADVSESNGGNGSGAIRTRSNVDSSAPFLRSALNRITNELYNSYSTYSLLPAAVFFSQGSSDSAIEKKSATAALPESSSSGLPSTVGLKEVLGLRAGPSSLNKQNPLGIMEENLLRRVLSKHSNIEPYFEPPSVYYRAPPAPDNQTTLSQAANKSLICISKLMLTHEASVNYEFSKICTKGVEFSTYLAPPGLLSHVLCSADGVYGAGRDDLCRVSLKEAERMVEAIL